jgi:DNA replication protein DnaC
MKRIGDVLTTISIPIGPRSRGDISTPPAPACPRCQGAGWVRHDVPVGHPSFGRLFPCDCKSRERERRHVESLGKLSNLDGLGHLTFDTFEVVEGTEAAFHAATEFAADPAQRGWLYLHGPCGVGKTHLAIAAALEIRRENPYVLFAVVPDLLDHLRATFDPTRGVAYDERFDRIRSATLLVLDDLGTENTTPWAREKLYQLFNHRYNERLPTIITSNQEHKLIDERVLSRLLDTHLTRDVRLDALDYRRRGRPDYFRPARR